MKLSIEKLSELLEEPRVDFRRENLIAKCPKCGYKEFGVSLSDNHRFGCYRKKKCGYSGNIFTLLHLLKKYDEYVTRGEIYSVDTNIHLEKKIRSRGTSQLTSQPLPTIQLPVGWKRTFDNDYLNERGFTDIDYHKFPVGTTKLDSKFENYIIFSIEEEGKTKATVARHIWDKKRIDRYNELNPTKKIARYTNSISGFEQLVLGLDDLDENTNTLIIVEGVFDKANIDRLLDLDYQNEVKCVGTFKCHVSPSQLNKIKQKAPNIREVILLYDNDVLKEIIDTGLLLEQHYEVNIAYDDTLTVDAGDMTSTALESLLSSLWQVNNLARKKIQKKQLG